MAVGNVNQIKVYLPDLIGGGYKKFWFYRGRYRVVKGSRASKKSKTTALWYIYNLMKYPAANLLVIRKTERTLRNSCYADLIWAMKRLHVEAWFKVTSSPLEITYKPTGQKIIFRGLDDPLKITSIAVEHGCLCWVWLEECYELMREEDFDFINESIRGEVPEGLFKQFTITFNPWNSKHWLKKRFFDVTDDDILAMTTNYTCNEWLDDADRKMFETMKKRNPKRYQVAGLGDWGIVEGLVFENWREEKFDWKNIARENNTITKFGLDFGYTNDPTALFCSLVDIDNKRIYVFDELYEKGLTNDMIYKRIERMGYTKEKVTADSAEPKSIQELRNLGLFGIRKARKGKDSINNGIQFLQNFEIIVHPRCVNFITEISNYMWDEDKFGKKLNKPIDDFNHLMDAMRYATEDLQTGDMFSFNDGVN